MKKLLLSLAALCFGIQLTNAQTSGGPDLYGYTWKDSNDPNGPTYNWIDITSFSEAQEVESLADDNTKGPFVIGFPFHYYWYDVSTFWVGSNGYISFGNSLLASPFKQIPDTVAPQNFIAAFEADLNFDGVGNPAECWQWKNLQGDTLIISWINVPFWDQGTGFQGSNSFQIILSAIDSSITMQYLQQTGTYNGSFIDYLTIGIENNSGAIGLQHSHDVYPPINYAIKYYYPANTTFQVNDASCSYNTNDITGGIFLSKNATDTFPLITEIKNTGNTTLNPFNVQSSVKAANGLTVSSNAIASDTLLAGATQTITFAQGFLHNTAGTFRNITTTLLAGDATPSNNTKVQEVVVVDTTTANQWLSYDNGIANTPAGISWAGGNGGTGVYIIPPYYPCVINSVRCFITADPNLVGYSAMIFDDKGANKSPGQMLDSQFVATTSLNSWNISTLSTPLQIDSGGVYVSWYMGGDGVALGLNTTAPISNRTFEILGNSWAIYRNREIEDLMININISKVSFQGVNDENKSQFVSEPYPNPSSGFINMDFQISETLNQASYTIYNLQGEKITQQNLNILSNNGTLKLNVNDLSSGFYVCKLKLNDYEFSRKINILK